MNRRQILGGAVATGAIAGLGVTAAVADVPTYACATIEMTEGSQPGRYIYFIDVGRMPPAVAERHLAEIVNDIMFREPDDARAYVCKVNERHAQGLPRRMLRSV